MALKFTYRVYAPFDSYGQPLVLPEGRRVAYEARSFKWIDDTRYRSEYDDVTLHLEISHMFVEGFFLDIERQAELADCERRRMGCVVSNNMFEIKGRGHNGKPHGVDGKCQTIGCIPSLTCRLTLHAEQSALNEIPKERGESLILFCTAAPCIDCLKVCVARGVRAVVYQEERDQPEYDRPILSALSQFGRVEFIKVTNE